MNAADDMPPGIDERVERLICRLLDQEATPEERAELAGILARDPAARALFEEYERNDKLAAAALHHDLEVADPPAAQRRYSGWWLGVGGALAAAAAVIVVSFLPGLWSPGRRVAQDQVAQDQVAQDQGAETPVIRPMNPGGVSPRRVNYSSPQWRDYRDVDYRPHRRLRDVRRDLIGIRGKNKNVIYIFERDTHSTRIVPISGDI